MAGHNKWSQIKHRKGAQDAKRGQIFTKISKEIVVAAKAGGIDESKNFRLRAALSWAKSENMPADNIARAIKKASGASLDENLEQVMYEGYGPAGVAIIVECLTDNTNRSFASIRNIFNKAGGSLGQINSVRHLFDKVAAVYVADKSTGEDLLLEILLESKGKDLLQTKEGYCLIVDPEEMSKLSQHLIDKNISLIRTELILTPKVKTMIEDTKDAKQIIKLIDNLEEDEDVQKVFSNFDIAEKLAKKLE